MCQSGKPCCWSAVLLLERLLLLLPCFFLWRVFFEWHDVTQSFSPDLSCVSALGARQCGVLCQRLLPSFHRRGAWNVQQRPNISCGVYNLSSKFPANISSCWKQLEECFFSRSWRTELQPRDTITVQPGRIMNEGRQQVFRTICFSRILCRFRVPSSNSYGPNGIWGGNKRGWNQAVPRVRLRKQKRTGFKWSLTTWLKTQKPCRISNVNWKIDI